MGYSKGLLQEKFQRTEDQVDKESDHEWLNLDSFKNISARKIYKANRMEHYASEQEFAPDQGSFSDPKFNYMPPGMFIDNQEPMVTERPYKYVAAGATDVTDNSTVSAMKHGFVRQEMTPVDDMYNNEHVEEFYGEATGEDDKGQEYTGFAERNNYMDRN